MRRSIAPAADGSTTGPHLHNFGLPAVAMERCARTLSAASACRACVDACPTGAWSLDGDGVPVLDAGECDGCGLCAPACPTGVIAHHHAPALRGTTAGPVAFAACARTGLRNGPDGIAGVLPCLNLLGLGDLLRLYAAGARRLVVTRHTCAACPTGTATAQRLEKGIAELNLLLDSRGLAPLRLARRSRVPWQAQFLFDSEPTETPPPAADPTPPARRLPAAANGGVTDGGAALWPWVPSVDASICHGCAACAGVCPTAALRHSSDPPAFLIEPADCTGCRLCVDVCGKGGVILERLAPRRQSVVAIDTAGCAACAVNSASCTADDEPCDRCRLTRATPTHYPARPYPA